MQSEIEKGMCLDFQSKVVKEFQDVYFSLVCSSWLLNHAIYIKYAEKKILLFQSEQIQKLQLFWIKMGLGEKSWHHHWKEL